MRARRVDAEQAMDYVLLSPEEAATLLNISPEEIVQLVETGELGGLRVAGHWRVPLKSITQMLAAGIKTQTARALEHVFEDHETWKRVFGAHPEVTQQIEAGEFPKGSVGAYLKEAIAIARSQRSGQVASPNTDPSTQDEDYEAGGSGQRQA
jgi:excisionase family DNA binding protein